MTDINSLSYGQWMTAICTWREARGTTMSAQKGVLHSIMNRAAHPSWWGNSLVSVVTCSGIDKATGRRVWQYSAMAPGDANSCLFPTDDDIMWYQIVCMVLAPGIDPTAGATHYYSTDIAEPAWAAKMTFMIAIGPFRFFK